MSPRAQEDQRWMQEALCLADQAAAMDEIPVGALVVYEGACIAQAHNLVQTQRMATAHAECLALKQAFHWCGTKYLPEATLYVTLEPCPMCIGMTFWAQLGRLVFGAPDPKRGYQRYQPSLLHPRTQVTQGVLACASTKRLQAFFQALRG